MGDGIGLIRLKWGLNPFSRKSPCVDTSEICYGNDGDLGFKMPVNPNQPGNPMTQKMALKLHDTDNVAVCTSEVSAGDVVTVVAPDGARTEVKAVSDIAFCNKVALRTIAEGDVILKYGEAIGCAVTGIPIGALADHHNIASQPRAYADEYLQKGE